MTENKPMWVNADKVLLNAMLRSGRLWVAECMPIAVPRVNVWEAWCKAGDTMGRLMVRMASEHGLKLPQRLEAQSRAFNDAVLGADLGALVFHDAQLLHRATLLNMRILSEEVAPVILVGDLLGIGAAVKGDASFMLRAGFCVKAMEI